MLSKYEERLILLMILNNAARTEGWGVFVPGRRKDLSAVVILSSFFLS